MNTLENRDYTVIIDKSGSMAQKDCPGGKSRWESAQESTLALAAKAETFDPDGLTLYLFNTKFKRHDNVTSGQVGNAFKEHEPNGGTIMGGVLKDAMDNYFTRKNAGKTKPNGEIIVVVTDGQPEDNSEVASIITAATKKMDKDEELGILFLQVGKDLAAREFLKSLDDDLVKAGAKFDIVNAKTIDEIGEMSLSDVLLGAIND